MFLCDGRSGVIVFVSSAEKVLLTGLGVSACQTGLRQIKPADVTQTCWSF